ncbi:MAG: AMP-binding protein [Ilumatobacter sp.]|uniref:AMP-binding protein n=1 Tax=Ilumatobacter sp. TaxID=1967498 RepID=UPI00260E3336|nr:AMP-binding protein [Ilumatobacter sp.]MDJ0770784.1 AMP-binding protein [Ilumatobacter sp.]
MARLSAPHASSRGGEAAVIDDAGSLTWREFDERVNRCLDGLRARGHEAGSTVALLCGNRREFLEASSALFHGGYLFPPVNWHFSAAEVAYVLGDSGASAVVVDGEFIDLALAAVDRLGAPIDVVVTGAEPTGSGTSYEQMLADASPAEPEDQTLGSVMMYTSGTTGNPKGVRSTGVPLGGDIELGQLAVDGYTDLFGIDRGGRSLVTAPLYHGGPYVFGAVPFAAGCTIVLRQRFDPAGVLADIDALGITNAYFVPTHFARLLRLPDDVKAAFDGSTLRTVWHTAAPCPPDIKRAMIEWWGPVIHETYAASDAGIGTLISSEQWLAKPGSVGPASPLSEILVVGEDGERLAAGEVGTIYIHNRLGGDMSYHNAPEKTAAAHLAPGVVTVGDIGYLDDDGYLFLSDREIDMIISGGVNIYPAEIEARLVTHPSVVDAAVFGIPDDEFGEGVCAAVLLVDGSTGDEDTVRELQAFCRETLAGYKVPRSFEFPDALPRTATGKLVKRLLRDPHWEHHGRQI